MPAAALHSLHWPDGPGGGPGPAASTSHYGGWQIVTMTSAFVLFVLGF